MNKKAAIARRLIPWAAVFAGLLILFSVFDAPEAEASADESVTLTVQTEDGPMTMTMAEYLPGAVAGEMPADFCPEALKAQAIAVRSYVLRGTRHGPGTVCTDSACCLAWKSRDELRALWGDAYDLYYRAVSDAAAGTDGQYLAWEGEPILAVFHDCSEGATEDSGAIWSPLPYLISVDSPETPDAVPGLLQETAFSPAELRERLGLTPEGEPDTWLAGTQRDDAGRVAILRIGGQSLSGRFVREALALRSTDFDVRWADGVFRFTTAGHGHGVGMSQWGAELMARDGADCAAILAHYYPGTELLHL